MLKIGSVLDNKYKILSIIGHGGMSVVYLAINERANKTWAVKEVRKNGVTDFEAVRQGLIVETNMLKKLSHPHLPSIIDVIDTKDSFLIVMDYIEGTSLQDKLEKEGAQPEDKVIRWGKQLCDVLGYLHKQNPPIIYRDMKPGNVMLKPDGNVTLIDFGIAREFKNRAMVQDTTCLGTRGYAAPEQFGGKGQTDPRTDVYCLGATLYHLITGHSPAEPPYEIKPLSYWLPQYTGSGLEKVILKCTKQDPDARYQNCAELMYALVHYRDEDDVNRAKRKKKWNAFVASLVIGAVGLCSTLGFYMAGRNIKSQSIDSYIAEAEEVAKGSSLNDAVEDYISALKIDATNSKIYDSILNAASNEINNTTKDEINNYFGSGTQNALEDLENCRPSTTGKKSIDQLKESNWKEYCKYMYQVGRWQFFNTGDVDNNKIDAVTRYLEPVSEDNSKLTGSNLELAKCLIKIGKALQEKTSNNSDITSAGVIDGTDETDNTNNADKAYADLYIALDEIVKNIYDCTEEELTEVVTGESAALYFYKFAANKIGTYCSNMTGSYTEDNEKKEVKKADLKTTLENIETGLNNLPKMKDEKGNTSQIDEVKKSIASARKQVETLK